MYLKRSPWTLLSRNSVRKALQGFPIFTSNHFRWIISVKLPDIHFFIHLKLYLPFLLVSLRQTNMIYNIYISELICFKNILFFCRRKICFWVAKPRSCMYVLLHQSGITYFLLGFHKGDRQSIAKVNLKVSHYYLLWIECRHCSTTEMVSIVKGAGLIPCGVVLD